ncbi:CDC48 family AAA ATPase [Methermicoccus shengliensis]|uniref:CDC48 family AAA ATPase n=1 Tax=Methermicoccus shengliensis TaxID=660064 RepID=A0A832RXV8_9EURY|nr:CDC48 family AAA ATPase [Methermicoccus shengliensis]MDI3487779.1 transitional endoplasmic reticulum ATPase [Methanosarcinales archaeon]MDN5294865.1 transitional endoplasmic reticulum ATPase [Methanosarcinales archaeon]HIH69884.1 CDC48 family AAA ATPase [Methermicoccus shengliensis]
MSEITLKVAKAYPADTGRGIARLDPSSLLKLQISPGDVIQITGKKTTVAKVWRADRQDWGQDIIRIDGFTRQNAGAGIGERVKVVPIEPRIANTVMLAPVEVMDTSPSEMPETFIKRQLLKRPVMTGDVVPIISGARPFMGRQSTSQMLPLVVVDTDPAGPVMVDEFTKIVVRDKPATGMEALKGTGITYEDIGGLKEEVQRVREMIELPLKHPELFERLGIEPPKGVLLYGPSGTGKTLIAKAVANEAGASFFSIAGPEIMSKYYGESEQRLRDIFEEAEENAPSIIFIDELDSIAPKREEVTGEVERRVVAQLLTEMDGLEERGQVVVIGATNRIDAIDPALRRGGRFDREIEIGVPDADARFEIFQIHTRGMPLEEDVDLRKLADRTHGFVGADIAALCRESAMKALRRYLPDINLDEPIPEELLESMRITKDDFEAALREIEPSAMREVFLEVPKVTWDMVGALERAKQDIREAVEWPLKYPEKFKERGLTPPRGILLYGPPGTGKTLLAKAVATESESNFICVRGPELLSKWVGESEKAIREIFKKARQVAPSIVFFDELDAIAPMRGADFGDSHVTERVISQLLTELDGLEGLKGVVVIGATNRPDIIDPALVRSGRFDRLVFVGPPDRRGRKEIFQIHTRGMPLAEDVDFDHLADLTEGYVGSDIELVCREAAMESLREDFDDGKVRLAHFLEALKRVRPTIDESLMDYYARVAERFKGGMKKEEPRSYIGYR